MYAPRASWFVERQAVGLGDVVRVDSLEAKPWDVGDRDECAAIEKAIRGTSGPRKSLRISVAASCLKMSPGRSRTTRVPGSPRSKSSRCDSTSALWRE